MEDRVDLLAGSGDGRVPEPTNPVTFGVDFTRCQESSVISISTST